MGIGKRIREKEAVQSLSVLTCLYDSRALSRTIQSNMRSLDLINISFLRGSILTQSVDGKNRSKTVQSNNSPGDTHYCPCFECHIWHTSNLTEIIYNIFLTVLEEQLSSQPHLLRQLSFQCSLSLTAGNQLSLEFLN